MAWVRHGSEFYLPAVLNFLVPVSSLCPFSCSFPFSSPFSSYTEQARYSGFPCISVWFCINALGLRESSSRLGLHNNALGLRESLSRLGLHKMPLVCVNPCHNLVCITMPMVCPLFLSSVWLPSSLLNPGPGRLPASSYK